jgi:trimethylamine--corrinoid protein Co-methyltransferase
MFRLLDDSMVSKIQQEALGLLMDPGVRVHNAEALNLLGEAGAQVDLETRIAYIPDTLVESSIESAPSEFYLHDLNGDPKIRYGGDTVHFDPGSAAITILDRGTQRQRPAVTADFVAFVQLVEGIHQLDAQSTAMICSDVPEEIGDLYRLYLALQFMQKPIVTGAFRVDSWRVMRDLLAARVGGEQKLKDHPIAIFDVCPSPPLLWSDLTCQNLIDCARAGIPSELVSMPLAGATAPVTLAGAVIQHTAENLSGIVISQLAKPGAPIVWGGSPSVFEMRHGTTPMGAVGTWMIDSAYVQVGKAFGFPTHAYLGMTDSKVVDAQAGLESAGGTLLAALSGVNMVSGAGMMDFESCQSFEKLVIDSEIIGMAKRLIQGIELREDPIALDHIRALGHRADYLSETHTLKWFAEEFYLPSEVIDRTAYETWEAAGGENSWERASHRVDQILSSYEPIDLDADLRIDLQKITINAAKEFGMDTLPAIPGLS